MALPNFVCIGGGSRYATRSGFLGPNHQPFDVASPDRGTDYLEPLIGQNQFSRQVELLRRFNAPFHETYRAEQAEAHQSALDRAVQLMGSKQKQAFDLSREPQAVHDRYGRGDFGQGCLMARRLIEAEIWMGEFGRAPQCTGGGRNHWARAWSSVLVGGGIRGGQVVGRTDPHGAEVVERPISVTDFLATVCTLLGIDYSRQNVVPGIERPISIVDTTKQVRLISELQ